MKLEEMRAITAAATEGPWDPCYHLRSKANDESCNCGTRGHIWGGDKEFVVCEMGSTIIEGQEGLEPPRYSREQELKNAAFIFLASNKMDKLLAVAKAAKSFCDNFAEFETITDGPIIDMIYEALEELEKENETQRDPKTLR